MITNTGEEVLKIYSGYSFEVLKIYNNNGDVIYTKQINITREEADIIFNDWYASSYYAFDEDYTNGGFAWEEVGYYYYRIIHLPTTINYYATVDKTTGVLIVYDEN